MGLREQINERPWTGWVVAGVALIALGVMYYRFTRGSASPFSAERMTDTLTIKFTDTDETMEMTRGELVKSLAERSGNIDPAQGVTNPKTGKPTGFVYDKNDWELMVKQINQAKDNARTRHPTK